MPSNVLMEATGALAPSRAQLSPPKAMALVKDALTNTLTDPTGRWILSPQPDARSEHTLTGFDQGHLTQVRLDRTFSASGARWVVDFKASTIEGAGRTEFLAQQLARYRIQLDRYAALLGASGGAKVNTALYFPALAEWRST